jgi:hypothetical protein
MYGQTHTAVVSVHDLIDDKPHLCNNGWPAISGTLAEALRQTAKSSRLLKFWSKTGRRLLRQEATTWRRQMGRAALFFSIKKRRR